METRALFTVLVIKGGDNGFGVLANPSPLWLLIEQLKW